jgi:putative ABC transport system permease protein
LYPQVTYKVSAHLSGANIRNTIASINAIWNRYCPGYPLDYNFLDESYDQMYKTEEKLSALLSIFTVLSVVVGCLGLFALSAFSAEQRVREIGIRKVLGANVTGIVGLLAKNFLLLVLIACVVASPIAWWAMSSWLDDFPYRVSLGAGTFMIATIAALFIALVTVSFQSIRAAMTNPVRSLRTD